jgi:hypothetical protein
MCGCIPIPLSSYSERGLTELYTVSIVGVVKGQELRALRGTRTQVTYAEQLGVQANTVARYERDELPIPEPVARLARCLARLKRRRPRTG